MDNLEPTRYGLAVEESKEALKGSRGKEENAQGTRFLMRLRHTLWRATFVPTHQPTAPYKFLIPSLSEEWSL